VGSAPAESLLRQLAEETGGACELVTPWLTSKTFKNTRKLHTYGMGDCAAPLFDTTAL